MLDTEAVARKWSVKKVFLKIWQNSHEKPLLDSSFNKVAVVGPVTLLKKRLQRRCFLVNFAKFLRISFL